jgi:5-methylcytosine-specific restriction protein A
VGVVVPYITVITISITVIIALPVRPSIHRPVGRREKRERDQDYQRNRDPVSRALYRSKRWRTERAAFLAEHQLCAECRRPGSPNKL